MLDPAKLKDQETLDQYITDDGDSSLVIDKQGKRWCLQLQGAHLDYEACYDELGEDLLGELGQLGIKIRKELYAGKLDALQVMSAYCNGERLTKKKNTSPAAKILTSILEAI